MRTVDLLHELQGIDTQLDGTRATLAQLQKQIGDRSALEPLSQELTAIRGALHKIEAEQRDLELNAESKRTKIAADEGKLYSGRVTNPKELESLALEVQQEKHQLSIVDDHLLELMDAGETTSKRVGELQAQLERDTADWNARQTQARSRAEELDTLISALEDNRPGLVGQVEPPTLATYDNLRRQKGGLAIGTVVQRTCQACRVALTPAIEQRARIGADLVSCPSCGRLLFVPLG